MLAQVVVAGPAAGWTLGQLAIAVVVAAAVIALVWVALNQFGVTIPPWVQQVGWILIIAIMIVIAIKIVIAL